MVCGGPGRGRWIFLGSAIFSGKSTAGVFVFFFFGGGKPTCYDALLWHIFFFTKLWFESILKCLSWVKWENLRYFVGWDEYHPVL